MKCPACENREGIKVSAAEGFTIPGSPIKECSGCGLIWRIVPGEDSNVLDVIKVGNVPIRISFKK